MNPFARVPRAAGRYPRTYHIGHIPQRGNFTPPHWQNIIHSSLS